nr:post-transcriptional regulator [Cohnella sp. REN36]
MKAGGGPELNSTLAQLCESKAEEFRLLGYDQVSGPDVWECVSDKYHKSGTPPLHAVVNDILSLKVTQYMNFITLSMYRGEKRR